MGWLGILGLFILFAYVALPAWAYERRALFFSDFVTLVGMPVVWFLLIRERAGDVASLANFFLEGLIVIPAGPMLLAFRLFGLKYVMRDARTGAFAVAAFAIIAAVALRLMMPTMPE